MDSSKLPPKRNLVIAGVFLFGGFFLHYYTDTKLHPNEYLRDYPEEVFTYDKYSLDNTIFYARRNSYEPGGGNRQFTATFEYLQAQRETCCCQSPLEDLDYIQSMFEYYLDDPHDEVRFPPEFFEVNQD